MTQTRVAYGSTSGGQHVGQLVRDVPSRHALRRGNYVHPVDETLGSTVAANYNAYVKTGDMTGQPATSFTSLVPFVERHGDLAMLASHAKNNDTVPGRPAVDRPGVVPLVPPRARLGSRCMLRFDIEYEFMT